MSTFTSVAGVSVDPGADVPTAAAAVASANSKFQKCLAQKLEKLPKCSETISRDEEEDISPFVARDFEAEREWKGKREGEKGRKKNEIEEEITEVSVWVKERDT